MGDAKAEVGFAAEAGSALAMGGWGTARALALSWLDSLATWLEATEAWPAADKATLRMDEVGVWGLVIGGWGLCGFVCGGVVSVILYRTG